EAGLGSGREEGYGRLCLARVEALGADGEPCPLPTAHPPAPMSEADLAAASGRLPERALTLRLMTPTYLKAGGRLAEPSAPLLLRRLAWRVRELVRLHGAGETPDFRPLLEAVSVRGRFAGEGLATGHRFSRRQTRE